MKKCCDNCANLTKTADGFYCPVSQKRIITLYKRNGCKRFVGVGLYERD